MANEEMQRTIQFILEHQAQLFTSLESLKEIVRMQSSQIAQHSAQIAQHSAQIAEHSAQIAQHSAQIAENSSQISSLRDLLLRTLRIIEEQGRQTDERINALVLVVERYFSNGRKPSE